MPVRGLSRSEDRWQPLDADGDELGRYDAVVVSAAAPQTAALLEPVAPALAARARRVNMAPCWAAMVTFADPLDPGFDGAFVHDAPLRWVMRERLEAGAAGLRGVGSPRVTRLDAGAPGAPARRLRHDSSRLSRGAGRADAAPMQLDAHRWRFALPTEPLSEECLFEPDPRWCACGDWCGGPRVEGAFLSGSAAAGRLLALRRSLDRGRSSNRAGRLLRRLPGTGRQPARQGAATLRTSCSSSRRADPLLELADRDVLRHRQGRARPAGREQVGGPATTARGEPEGAVPRSVREDRFGGRSATEIPAGPCEGRGASGPGVRDHVRRMRQYRAGPARRASQVLGGGRCAPVLRIRRKHAECRVRNIARTMRGGIRATGQPGCSGDSPTETRGETPASGGGRRVGAAPGTHRATHRAGCM